MASLAGIDIDVFDSLGNRRSANATTDVLGAYDVGILPPGQYHVRADPTLAQGYANRFFADAIDLAFADPVAVNAGATSPAIDLSVSPSGSISGTIVDGAGSGLAGIDLDLFEAVTNARLLPSATTDATGSYSFPSLNGASYKVRADPSFAQGFERRYHVSAEVVATATPVPLATGGTVIGADITLAPGAAISGLVTDGQTGIPVSDATIRFYRLPSGLPMDQLGTAAIDGSYLVWGLPAGSYLVLAAPPNGDPTLGPTWYGDTSTQGTATPVLGLAGGVSPDISIRLPEPRALVPGLLALALLVRRRGSGS